MSVRNEKSQSEIRRASRKEAATELYHKGMQYRRNGMFEKAIDTFDEAIKLSPENFSLHRMRELTITEADKHKAEVLFKKSQVAMEANDDKKAVKLLKEAYKSSNETSGTSR